MEGEEVSSKAMQSGDRFKAETAQWQSKDSMFAGSFHEEVRLAV